MTVNDELKTKSVDITYNERTEQTIIGTLVIQEDGLLSGAILKEDAAGMLQEPYLFDFDFHITYKRDLFDDGEKSNPVEVKGIADIVSPDAPMTTNEQGGSQSQVDVRFDLIDAKAMFEMAKVLDHGAKKYGANNWRKIDVDDHLNHLLMHTFAYLAGDRTDDHLSHILCRATFALGVKLDNNGE